MRPPIDDPAELPCIDPDCEGLGGTIVCCQRCSARKARAEVEHHRRYRNRPRQAALPIPEPSQDV